MKSVVTIDRNSKDFFNYLNGTFSKQHRAIPIQSLNVNSKNEVVTFEILPLSEIVRPHFLVIFLKVLRLRQFVFILFPLFYFLSDVGLIIRDRWLMFLSTIGLLFLYAAVQLRNDYHDHLNGLDRIQKEGSQVLQKGWWTAHRVKKLSAVFALLSFMCSWSVIFVFPQVLWVMSVAAILLFWSLFRREASFKNVSAGELVFGLLLGPLLSLGYEVSLTGSYSTKSFFFGCVWGGVVLFRLYVSNFETLLVSSQAGLKNVVTTLGFDKTKFFLKSWWIGILIIFSLFQSIYLPIYFWLGSVFILLLTTRNFFRSLNSLSSPVGSALRSMANQGVMLFNLFVMLWTVERLFFILAPEMMSRILKIL